MSSRARNYQLVDENSYSYPSLNGNFDNRYIFVRDRQNPKLGRVYKLRTADLLGKRFYYCQNHCNCGGSIKVVNDNEKVYEPLEDLHIPSCKAFDYESLLKFEYIK